jgi:hypothetical protein
MALVLPGGLPASDLISQPGESKAKHCWILTA